MNATASRGRRRHQRAEAFGRVEEFALAPEEIAPRSRTIASSANSSARWACCSTNSSARRRRASSGEARRAACRRRQGEASNGSSIAAARDCHQRAPDASICCSRRRGGCRGCGGRGERRKEIVDRRRPRTAAPRPSGFPRPSATGRIRALRHKAMRAARRWRGGGNVPVAKPICPRAVRYAP